MGDLYGLWMSDKYMGLHWYNPAWGIRMPRSSIWSPESMNLFPRGKTVGTSSGVPSVNSGYPVPVYGTHFHVARSFTRQVHYRENVPDDSGSTGIPFSTLARRAYSVIRRLRLRGDDTRHPPQRQTRRSGQTETTLPNTYPQLGKVKQWPSWTPGCRTQHNSTFVSFKATPFFITVDKSFQGYGFPSTIPATYVSMEYHGRIYS